MVCVCAQLQLACVCALYSVAFAVCVAYAIAVRVDAAFSLSGLSVRRIFLSPGENAVRIASRALLCFLVTATAPPSRRVVVGVVVLYFEFCLGSGWIRESDLSCFGLPLEVSGSPEGCDRSWLSVTIRLFTSNTRGSLGAPQGLSLHLFPHRLGLRDIPRSENHTTRQS